MNTQTTDAGMLEPAARAAWAVLLWIAGAASWCAEHAGVLLVAVAVPAIAAAVVHQVLTRRALAMRTRFVLSPTRRFDPSAEDIWRQSALLMRAAGKGPWWAPAAARRVRVRLRADGSVPLEYSVEAPSTAATLLADSRFQEVTVTQVPAAKDPFAEQEEQDRMDRKNKELQRELKAQAKVRKAEEKAAALAAKAAGEGVDLRKGKPGKPKRDGRLHAVRAEFVLRGMPSATLRAVPLTPDPLQPLIDAVADLQTDLGELAEVVLDIQSIPRWHLRLRQWQLMREARERSRAGARRAARELAADTAEAEDSLRFQLLSLLDPTQKASGPSRSPTVRPKAVEREEALGRLANGTGLVRIQLLVRCVSELEGRAHQLLEKVSAAMDVFGEDSRLSVAGRRFLKWNWGGADSRMRRPAFDRRWATGLVAPREQNWLRVGEIAGLLKPPTAHAVLPVLAAELPDYVPGQDLVPHGRLVSADGRSRIVATAAAEFLFSIAVGKSNYGKTEQAIVRALALGLAGHGLLFIDPHGDSWKKAAPYLAHPLLASRVRRIDLARAEADGAVLPTWNPLTMEGSPSAARVASAAVDALATALSWTDSANPRAITILTKAMEALVSYNQQVVEAGQPELQATLHQVRTLLSDKGWRNLMLQKLTGEQRKWWNTTFKKYKVEELAPVLNPLDRLAAHDVSRAFLGSPTGSYDIRKAMDEGQIVWLCLEGTGPSDKLLVSMIMSDLLRAGLSRRALPEENRRPFDIFADELIALDPSAGPSFSAITEQLRKFNVRLHVMTQLLSRVSATTRESIIQNSSVVSTTGGSVSAVKAVADEWHGAVSPARIAELPRFQQYVQVTAGGKKIGPLLVHGVQVEEVFTEYKQKPQKVKAMVKRADEEALACGLAELLERAGGQDKAVRGFLTQPKSKGAAKESGSGSTERGKNGGSSDGPKTSAAVGETPALEARPNVQGGGRIRR